MANWYFVPTKTLVKTRVTIVFLFYHAREMRDWTNICYEQRHKLGIDCMNLCNWNWLSTSQRRIEPTSDCQSDCISDCRLLDMLLEHAEWQNRSRWFEDLHSSWGYLKVFILYSLHKTHLPREFLATESLSLVMSWRRRCVRLVPTSNGDHHDCHVALLRFGRNTLTRGAHKWWLSSH